MAVGEVDLFGSDEGRGPDTGGVGAAAPDYLWGLPRSFNTNGSKPCVLNPNLSFSLTRFCCRTFLNILVLSSTSDPACKSRRTRCSEATDRRMLCRFGAPDSSTSGPQRGPKTRKISRLRRAEEERRAFNLLFLRTAARGERSDFSQAAQVDLVVSTRNLRDTESIARPKAHNGLHAPHSQVDSHTVHSGTRQPTAHVLWYPTARNSTCVVHKSDSRPCSLPPTNGFPLPRIPLGSSAHAPLWGPLFPMDVAVGPLQNLENPSH